MNNERCRGLVIVQKVLADVCLLMQSGARICAASNSVLIG